MKKNILILLICVICLFTNTIYAKEIPQKPAHNYYDEVGILSNESKKIIDASDKQIVVAIIEDLEGEDPHDFGVELFNNWGIGHKNIDDGALILLAFDKEDNKRYIRIITGYGREAILNDAKAGRIIDDYMLPYLKNGQYELGLMEGFKVVEQVYEDPGFIQEEDYNNYDTFGVGFFIFLFVAVIFRLPYYLIFKKYKKVYTERTALKMINNSNIIPRVFFFLGISLNILLIFLAFLIFKNRVIVSVLSYMIFNPSKGPFIGTGGYFGPFRGGRSSGGGSFGGGSFGGGSFGGGSSGGGGAGRSF